MVVTLSFDPIFVMDILNGIVVHGIKGDRSRYKPIDEYSMAVSSHDPFDVLKTINPKEVYIADLDRIIRTGDNLSLIRDIAKNWCVIADIGIKNIQDLELGHHYLKNLVIGTETTNIDVILKDRYLHDDIISLDIKDGKMLKRDERFPDDPKIFLKDLNKYNVNSIIILLLDKVGTETGINIAFLEKIRSISSHKLIYGGGIRGLDDIERLKDVGIDGALISTAVHKKNIPLNFLR